MTARICSCGDPGLHRIATRKTADDRTIVFWCDGHITASLGLHFAGIGPAREDWTRDADRTAARAFMGLIELLDFAEVAPAWRALRAECRKPYLGRTAWRWHPDRGGPSPAAARRIAFGALGGTP